MIKALHIRSSFNPGGTETLLLNLFNYKQNKIKFFFVLIKDGSYIKKLNNNNNEVYKFYRNHFLDFNVIRNIFKIIKNNNIKIVHTHQEIELIYAVILKFLFPSIKIYHSIHLTNPFFNKDYFIERNLIRFVKKVIVVSNSLKKFIVTKKGYPVNKIITLYNAVSLSTTITNNRLEKFKTIIKYKTDDFIMIMIGNFRKEKDHKTIIKAFNLLREKYPQLKLVFIGAKSIEQSNCEKITFETDINNRVFYLGAIEDAWVLLSLCNLFVFSSFSETFGISVIEALIVKIPVLTSNIDVMQELSEDGKYFTLFNTGNVNDLADKIEWFMNKDNKLKIKDTVDKAFQYSSNKFSYERFINQLVKVYSE